MLTVRRAVALVAVVVIAMGVRSYLQRQGDDGAGADVGAAVAAPAGAESATKDPALDTIPGTNWTRRDWEIFQDKIRWAGEQGLDTLPAGTAIARLARTFVGTTYVPGTLEAPGPEHLVVDLRELDCVTFVENVLALTRFARHQGVAALADPAAARRTYEGYLRDLRYRGGVLSGYPSRLHYFSEWLADNQARGLLHVITADLGGVPDAEPIDFMSTHPDAYRQLAEPGMLDSIRAVESRLNAAGPRIYLPEDRVEGAAAGIHDGDVIAATSSVPGLDVAHTGLAFWMDGQLYLIHAPLVGKAVQISDVPLALRIQGISGQDGIMVARVDESVF